jgi:long-chain acyl-CoA synthetase
MTDVVTDPETLPAERPASVAKMFVDRVAAVPDAEAFRYPVDDEWKSMTWAETKARVYAIAAGLLSLGIQPEDRVAIKSSTRIEWVLVDTAIMCAGAATTTVYPTSSEEDTAFVLSDSGSRVVFVEDETHLAKIAARRAELPDIMAVVLFNGTGDDEWSFTLTELEARGEAYLADQPNAVDDAIAAVGPEHLATLIYTSGTTGRPKGVRLVNDNWTYEAVAIDALRFLRPDHLQYLWLPLSHSFGKVLLTAQLRIGFASAVDGRVDRLVDNLAVVRPTFMAAAPRIFEKVHARINTMQRTEGGLKYRIFTWAIDVGIKVSRLRRADRPVPRMLTMRHKIADKLVFSKIRHRFGGHLELFVSGAASLSPQIAEWFHAVGILVLEGYGLTETSAFSAVNRPTKFLFGTVGLPAPGTQIRIADDGEVLIKGPGVMRGYHNLPEQTAEAIDSEGWFHTGDIGEFDGEFLRITDRKKDLIKTSGGKYVSPQAIEVAFKAICPYVSQVIVHGDKRNYVSALITLDEEAIHGWAQHTGLSASSYQDIVSSPQVQEMVAGYVDQLNARLNPWETVKKFTVLTEDLTVEAGYMTPSLKVRRRVVEEKYADKLDAMYG